MVVNGKLWSTKHLHLVANCSSVRLRLQATAWSPAVESEAMLTHTPISHIHIYIYIYICIYTI